MKQFLDEEEIKIINYLEKQNSVSIYNKNNNDAKIFDQKVTFAVLNVNCKCIVKYLNGNINKKFCLKDFFNFDYAKYIVSNYTKDYGKAQITEKTSKEYDKFFMQIFESLSYFNILKKERINRTNYYSCSSDESYDILNILSNNPDSCIAYVCKAAQIVLNFDLKIKISFENYIKHSNSINCESFKDTLRRWWFENSKHRFKTEYDPKSSEQNQICCKIIDPLFYLYEMKKNTNGKSDIRWTRADISYFKLHKRDYKRKCGETRQEMIERQIAASFEPKISYSSVRKIILEWNQQMNNISNNYISELNGDLISDGPEVHHLWPREEFQDDTVFNENSCENLIVLSHGQHRGYAHKKGATKYLNKNALIPLLKQQYKKILFCSEHNIGNYSIKNFCKLLAYICNHKIRDDEMLTNHEIKSKIDYYFDMIPLIMSVEDKEYICDDIE